MLLRSGRDIFAREDRLVPSSRAYSKVLTHPCLAGLDPLRSPWSGNRGDMGATATTERRKAAAPGGGYSARFQQAPSAPVPLEDPHGSLYASTPYLTTTAIARARSALVSDTESYPERHGAGSSLRDKQRLRRVGRPRRPILEDPFERRACQRGRTEKRIRSRRLQTAVVQ